MNKCPSELSKTHEEQAAANKCLNRRSTTVFGPSRTNACHPSVVDGVEHVPNPPRCVKEGTSGLRNPLHGFCPATFDCKPRSYSPPVRWFQPTRLILLLLLIPNATTPRPMATSVRLAGSGTDGTVGGVTNASKVVICEPTLNEVN